MSSEDHALERARRRAHWPGTLTTLDRATDAAVVGPELSPEERVAMVGRLTMDAWALSGLPFPTYRRAEMPGRMIRPAG